MLISFTDRLICCKIHYINKQKKDKKMNQYHADRCIDEAIEILCNDPNATDEMVAVLIEELFKREGPEGPL